MSAQAVQQFSLKPGGMAAEQLGGAGAVPAPSNWADDRPSGLVVLHTDNMKQLPTELSDATTAEKLAYLWVYINPGEYSARSLSAALGVDVRTALGDLTRKGLLLEEVPPAGRRPGQYRATPQRPGPRPRKSEGETS